MADEIKLIKASPGYYKRHGLPTKRRFYRDVIGRVSLDGLWLEFGTGQATSTSTLASIARGQTLYTFDWLKGLPEDWEVSPGEIMPKGTFGQDIKTVKRHLSKKKNVVFVEGLFQETLGPFLKEFSDPVAFMHVDCDIYSSTKYILDALRDRIRTGTVIIFDEFYNYPYYRNHEYKAWMETGLDYEYLAHVVDARQVALRVL